MTPLSQKIFDEYQVRKTKKQKLAFIELLKSHFPELRIQEGGFPKCRNIIIGDINAAKVVLTAHYDTCAQLPFPNFIMPKRPLFTILCSLLMTLPIVVLITAVNLLLGQFITDFWVHYWISLLLYLGLVILLLAGPANRHTANDNTSGVITLCELLCVLPVDQRKNTAFVFFDHEETGLIGSSLFRSKYKKIMAKKLLINLDCVSDGDHILLSVSKAARKKHLSVLKESFQSTDTKNILFAKAEKTYYPSDQMGFKKTVAVAALKRKRFFGYYMDRIHTSRDTVFDKENIKLLCDSIHRLLTKLA